MKDALHGCQSDAGTEEFSPRVHTLKSAVGANILAREQIAAYGNRCRGN